MEFTQEQLESAGYHLKAAPSGDWRTYAGHKPVPGYFEFDWLSARHPDLYHAFARSTVGLMDELNQLVDLSGLDVIDAGAGTGRSTLEAAKIAKHVTAVDIYEAVVSFGNARVAQAGLSNVTYLRGDGAHLPFANHSFDAWISSWAVPWFSEAYRVLKPGGFLFVMGSAPGALCGELTSTLADAYPDLITAIAPAEQLDAAFPKEDTLLEGSTWNGLPVASPVMRHDFTYTADYGDIQEAAAILGRLYGPKARQYMLDRQKSTLAWRLRIEVARIKK